MRNSLNDTPNLVQSASHENQSPNFPHLENPINSLSDILIDSDNNNVETEVHHLFTKQTHKPKFLPAMPSKSSKSKFNSSEDSYSEPENLKTSNADLDPENYKKRNPFSFRSGSDENSVKFKTATFTDMIVDARATADGTNPNPLKLKTRLSTDQEIKSPNFNHTMSTKFFGDGATKSLFKDLSPQINSATKVQFFKQEVHETSIRAESTESIKTPEKTKQTHITPIKSHLTLGTLGDQTSEDLNAVGWNANNFLTRAKIRAAFAQAIGNNIFNATNKELHLIKDKAYVMNQETRKERKKNTGRKLPTVKKVLEKHGIIRDNIKKSEMQKILREIGKSRTVKESFIRRYLVLRKYLENSSVLIYLKKVFVMTILDPYSMYRIGWDILSLLLIFYDLMLIPFQMGFNVIISGFFLTFEYFEDAFFVFDILLNFRTGFYRGGVLVKKNREIMLHYLKRWFALDVLAIVSSSLFLDIFFDSDTINGNNSSFRLIRFVRFVRFMRVLRALRLKKLFQKVDDLFYSNFYNTVKSLATLLFYVALVAHLSACLWFFVADTFGEYFGDSWIYHGGISDMSVMARYTVSLFWAITTMLTVGYGDITPMNTLERAINIILMLVGCGVFAYSMNKIGMLVQSLNAQASETRQIYYNVVQCMHKMNVSKDLRGKVMQYLDYMKQNQKYGKFGGDQVFSILSENLRDEIRKDINGQVLREDKILLKNFDSKFLSILSYKLEERNFSPGEIIFDEIDKSCSLYFLTTGTVEIYLRSCDTVISQIDGGQHFGELSFFTGRPRTAAARSSTFTHILLITREAFLSLVQDYPIEEETYHCIKDQMSIYNNYSIVSVQCTVCGSNTHDARSCPRVHYVPDRQAILKTYQKNSKDFMMNFKRRRRRRRFHAFTDHLEILAQAKTWCADHPKEIKKLSSNNSFRMPKLSNISHVSPRHPMKNEIIAELQRRRTLLRPIHTGANYKFAGSPDELSPLEPKPQRFPKKPSDPGNKPKSRSFISDDEEDNRTANSLFQKVVPASKFQLNQNPDRSSFLGRGKLPVCPIRFDSVQQPSSRTALEDPYQRAIEESMLNYELQQRLEEYQRLKYSLQPDEEITFDMVWNFKVYFPHNNISTILEAIKIKQNEEAARARLTEKKTTNVRKVNSMKTITAKKKPSSVSSLSFAFKYLKSEKNINGNHSDRDADSEGGSMRRFSNPKRPEIKTAFKKKNLSPGYDTSDFSPSNILD